MNNFLKIVFLFLILLNTDRVYSNSIDGVKLKEIVKNWLEKNGQISNVKILNKLKYPHCDDEKIIVNDISGNFKLIKVECIDKNPWNFIVRNKLREPKQTKIKNTLNTYSTYALKANLKKGTVLSKEHLKEIKRKKTGKRVYISNELDIVGKKLIRIMNSNIYLEFGDLYKDWLIEKDTIVTIINKKASITVKETGIALENADFMDRLIVKNIKSGKIIHVYAKNKKNVVFNTKQF